MINVLGKCDFSYHAMHENVSTFYKKLNWKRINLIFELG